ERGRSAGRFWPKSDRGLDSLRPRRSARDGRSSDFSGQCRHAWSARFRWKLHDRRLGNHPVRAKLAVAEKLSSRRNVAISDFERGGADLTSYTTRRPDAASTRLGGIRAVDDVVVLTDDLAALSLFALLRAWTVRHGRVERARAITHWRVIRTAPENGEE